jgi:hypothetical protein
MTVEKLFVHRSGFHNQGRENASIGCCCFIHNNYNHLTGWRTVRPGETLIFIVQNDGLYGNNPPFVYQYDKLP